MFMVPFICVLRVDNLRALLEMLLIPVCALQHAEAELHAERWRLRGG
jgi:hypothetical protein